MKRPIQFYYYYYGGYGPDRSKEDILNLLKFVTDYCDLVCNNLDLGIKGNKQIVDIDRLVNEKVNSDVSYSYVSSLEKSRDIVRNAVFSTINELKNRVEVPEFKEKLYSRLHSVGLTGVNLEAKLNTYYFLIDEKVKKSKEQQELDEIDANKIAKSILSSLKSAILNLIKSKFGLTIDTLEELSVIAEIVYNRVFSK